jgi:HK97 family phage prohead protease
MPVVTHEIETRTMRTEVRAAADAFALHGRAVSYNTTTRIKAPGGDFLEQVAPGAFSQSLNNRDDVKCTFNHDPNHILGRTKSGTLILTDSSSSLNFRCALDKTNSFHRDTYQAVKAANIDECSFAFRLQEDGSGDEWTTSKDENGRAIPLRTLRNVQLVDVSAVTYPQYSATNVSARSAGAGGASRSWAQRLAAEQGFVSVEEMEAASLRAVRSVLNVQASRIAADTDRDLRARAERARKIIEEDARITREENKLRAQMENAAGIVAGRRSRPEDEEDEEASKADPYLDYPYELASALTKSYPDHTVLGADYKMVYTKHASGSKWSVPYEKDSTGAYRFGRAVLGGHPLTLGDVS